MSMPLLNMLFIIYNCFIFADNKQQISAIKETNPASQIQENLGKDGRKYKAGPQTPETDHYTGV